MVPFAHRRLIARFTQRVFGLPSEHLPKCSGSPRRELADDHAVVELHGGHVEGRGEVDDDPVDLLRVERRHGVVVRVVDVRLLRGLDVLVT